MRKHQSAVLPPILIVAVFLTLAVFQSRFSFTLAQDKIEDMQAAAVPAPSLDPGAGEPPGFASSGENTSYSFNDSSAVSMDSFEAQQAIAASREMNAAATALPGGLDHAAAGTGTRNTGYGTIRLRSVPSGAVVVLAYLYWGTIVQGPQAPSTEPAVFAGTAITGSLIGTTNNPCWNSAGVFASYRADVKTLIQAGINGDYKVTGLPSATTNGRDPWSGAAGNTTLPLSEGASLLVVYSHSSVPTSARFYLYQTPSLFYGTLILNHTLNPVLPSHTTLRHTRLGADGQTGFGQSPLAFASDERTFIGQTQSSLTQIRGYGVSTRNYASDWNGFDNQPMNQLWDTNTDKINGTIPTGAGTYVIKYVSRGDCIVTVAHILSAL
jgi:hypothetical protein